jgi:hypothetical protein
MKKVFLTVIITFAFMFLVAMDPLPGICDDPVMSPFAAPIWIDTSTGSICSWRKEGTTCPLTRL